MMLCLHVCVRVCVRRLERTLTRSYLVVGLNVYMKINFIFAEIEVTFFTLGHFFLRVG